MASQPARQEDDSGARTKTVQIPTAARARQLLNGRYRVERELGGGGFGVVYFARDEALTGKPVVVKVLRETPEGDDWYTRKFHQEIQALARIEHPGVVGALDAGRTADGRPFLVMQYVSGTTLREALPAGGMEFGRAASIARQIGDALTAAHEKGVFHRDLKPDNVMLEATGGAVKLIDFGIASILRPQTPESFAMTRVAGSYDYMAPEQFEGKASAASDVYSFGVIAYEMLAGRRPFDASNFYDSMVQRRGGAPHPAQFRAGLPAAACEALLRALAVDPAQRYGSAREFGETLAKALSAPEVRTETGYLLAVELAGGAGNELESLLKRSPRLRQAEAAASAQRWSAAGGATIVFFGDAAAPVQCAMELAAALAGRPQLALRAGAVAAEVTRGGEAESNRSAMESARAVLDAGDAGHILLSAELAALLARNPAWVPLLHDLGAPLHVHNLWTGQLGNPAPPRARETGRWRLPGPLNRWLRPGRS